MDPRVPSLLVPSPAPSRDSSREPVPAGRRARRGWRAAILALAASAAPTPGLAGPRGSLLLGGEPPTKPPQVERDAWLPTGGAIVTPERPEGFETPGCSFRRPVCVHRHPAVAEADASAALAALERAHERLVLALALPAPAWDRGRGGTTGLDLYLVPAADGARPGEVELQLDPIDPWGFDRASAACKVTAGPVAVLERAATLCLGEALGAHLAPAATPSLRRAVAEHLWLATGTPTERDLELLDDAQASPERAIIGRELGAGTGGAVLLLELLSATRERGGPGTVATALMAAAATDTPPGALTWDAEPDVFDVLRHTLDERPTAVARLFGQLAVERAFLGSRNDGARWLGLDFTGDAGRIRFDWSLPLSTLPRRVAVTRPIEPTGAVVAWVELDEVLLTDRLGFQAEWEPPVAFQWTLVRVDADGRELSRVVAPYQEKATTVVQQLDQLASAAAVLVVGTNLGGVDLEHPHDPDLAPFEPSGCTIYLTPL